MIHRPLTVLERNYTYCLLRLFLYGHLFYIFLFERPIDLHTGVYVCVCVVSEYKMEELKLTFVIFVNVNVYKDLFMTVNEHCKFLVQ